MATTSTTIKGPAGPQGTTGATGIVGPTAVSTDSGNMLKLGNDSRLFAPNQMSGLATSSAPGLLTQVSGSTGDFVDGTNHVQTLSTALRPIIGSVRLRNFNTLGNPNFEVDQRTTGVGISGLNNQANAWPQDRWNLLVYGSSSFKGQQTSGLVNFPGTSLAVSGNFLRLTLNTQQATLGTSDYVSLRQLVEGSILRSLTGDFHSAGVLVRSSVANVSFSLALMVSGASMYNICHLLTLGAANIWAWLPWTAIPNLPTGSYYMFYITLAAGSGMISNTDIWGTGGYVAATGTGNFAANPVNSTFDIAFVQHQSGSLTAPPIDISFDKNLRACQRYYAKSLGYGQKYPLSGSYRYIGQHVQGSTAIRALIQFPVEMMGNPTMSFSSYDGTANVVYLEQLGNLAYSSVGVNSHGVNSITLSAAQTTTNPHVAVLGQWQADCGY